MRILLLLALFPTFVKIQQSPSAASLKNKNRVLLVFAPTDQYPDFERQMSLLDHHSVEMKDRDLIVIPVLVHVGDPTTANTLRTIHPPVASDQDQIELRHRFNVPSGEFTVILIGKDGGEKLRQHTPITVEKLNAVIDAMPMRRDEIRTRNP